MSAVGTAEAVRPQLVVRGRAIPVILPNRRDPRLKLAAVILTLQLLGQTVLGFRVSVAQILVCIGLCAIVDLAVTFQREGVLAWPASAMLTGNSVAFILRSAGTQHGDWWSLNGIQYFVLACVLSLLSKYLIRPGGRHIFNPSNVGLVWTLLILGPTRVFPQYLWWGGIGAPVILALVVILIGAVWILRPVRMVPMALSFMVPFAVLVGIFAASGRSFFAIWHDGPIAGASYWFNIVTSPEVLIFVFFMMSDPMTAPRERAGRMIYGAATAVVAAGLLYFQPTEFGIKVAILASLTVVCALTPLIDGAIRRARGDEPAAVPGAEALEPKERRWRSALRNPAILAAAIIALGAPIDTAALADDEQIVFIERGLAGPASPQ
ncbi:MAG: RnfABCDGE type electron transport complex subunit D [Actinomycetota bacterium]